MRQRRTHTRGRLRLRADSGLDPGRLTPSPWTDCGRAKASGAVLLLTGCVCTEPGAGPKGLTLPYFKYHCAPQTESDTNITEHDVIRARSGQRSLKPILASSGQVYVLAELRVLRRLTEGDQIKLTSSVFLSQSTGSNFTETEKRKRERLKAGPGNRDLSRPRGSRTWLTPRYRREGLSLSGPCTVRAQRPEGPPCWVRTLVAGASCQLYVDQQL